MFKRKRKNSERTTIVASKIKSPVKFQVEEAYKAARTNLTFSILKEGCKKIVVTSTFSKEGKTTTAVNLAIYLAQQENTKVLLIDCDLRRPRANQFFNVPNSPGLTDYLSKANTLSEVLLETEFQNLKMICSGTIPPNPSELLGSDKTKELITHFEASFDYIIIDTPPLNVVVDALPLSKLSDGVILSVMQGVSTHADLSKTIDSLTRIDAKILGFILNGVKDEFKKGYKYGYYKERDYK